MNAKNIKIPKEHLLKTGCVIMPDDDFFLYIQGQLDILQGLLTNALFESCIDTVIYLF